MPLEAIVQTRFLFAGKERKPGDIITSEELDATTAVVRDALVNQKMIILKAEGETTLEDRVADLERRLLQQENDIADLAARIPAEAAPARATGGKGR